MAIEKVENPLISIIMPVFNGERFIRQAIESVLTQNHVAIQLIVIDGGSNDSTLDIVRSYGNAIELIHQNSKGLALARNQALKHVKGNFMSFLDSDDFLAPATFKLVLSVFEQYPKTEFVYGKMNPIFEEGIDQTNINNKPMLSPVMGSGLFRWSAVQKLGEFIPEFDPCEDTEWLHRAKTTLNVKTIDEIILHKRCHDANLTNNTAVIYPQILKNIKLIIDRKHAQNVN